MGGCVEVEKVKQHGYVGYVGSPWEYGRPERRVAPLLDPRESQRRDDRGQQPTATTTTSSLPSLSLSLKKKSRKKKT
jgi:hypothetical protein